MLPGMNTFTYSQRGLLLTEHSEGCRLQAYWDATGHVWTIGTGHTGSDVVEGLVWTQEQADAALESDVATACNAVNSLVTVPLNQNQFDALVDFTFNDGVGAFKNSTLLRLLNAGDYVGANAQFALWVNSGGKRLPGLVTRRAAEAALFSEAS